MEIVTIEKRTFELWKQRFENFVGRVDALCVPLRRKRDKWLDNCENLPFAECFSPDDADLP